MMFAIFPHAAVGDSGDGHRLGMVPNRRRAAQPATVSATTVTIRAASECLELPAVHRPRLGRATPSTLDSQSSACPMQSAGCGRSVTERAGSDGTPALRRGLWLPVFA